MNSSIEKQENIDEVLLLNKMAKLYKEAIKDIKQDMLALLADLQADGFSRSVDLYNYAKYYDKIDAINARLVKLGHKEEKVMEPALINMYNSVQTILDASAPNRIKEAFVIPGRAEEVVKTVWCRDGKI